MHGRLHRVPRGGERFGVMAVDATTSPVRREAADPPPCRSPDRAASMGIIFNARICRQRARHRDPLSHDFGKDIIRARSASAGGGAPVQLATPWARA
jgi:hypothetical protein